MEREYRAETIGPIVTWENFARNFTLGSDRKYIKWEDWAEKVRASEKQEGL